MFFSKIGQRFYFIKIVYVFFFHIFFWSLQLHQRKRRDLNDETTSWFQEVRPGVDVMITIFCDFCQFSAKKLAFFSKSNVMIKFLHNLASF
jgi:hypothetical protein